MSDSKATENPDEPAVLSRRHFLKQASAAGASVGVASIASVAGIAGAVTPAEAEAMEEVRTYGSPVPDPSRETLGGAPVFDKQGAFSQPILKPLVYRVKALEHLIIKKGLLNKDTIDQFIQNYVDYVGPYIGKAVVAHAWVNPEFKRKFLNPCNPIVDYSRGHLY